MSIGSYVRVLRRGWLIVLAFLFAGVAAGTALVLTTTKVYAASVQVFVAASARDSADQLAQGNTFTQDRVQSYTSIADSPAVTDAVIRALGLKLTAQQLADKITADAPPNKVLINLHVTDQNREAAAELANAVATRFNRVVEQTEQADTNGAPVVKLTVIHPATVPTKPIRPNKTLDIGLGVLIGLLLGVGVVVLRDMLDTTVNGPADFEPLGLSVLGSVPLDKRTVRSPIAFRGDPHSLRSEAYRLLRTNLQFVNVDRAPRSIAVTSAIPGEGKSTTAINLAAALAEAGHNVCLVEADLRRPTIAKTLGLVGEVGFTTALIGRVPLEAALQGAGHNLTVLTSGAVPPNPSELLVTAQAHALLNRIAEQFEYTIIDSAPLLPVADGAELSALADATLVVHRAGKTTREEVARSVEVLERVGHRPVGVILNMVTRRSGGYESEYTYYSYRPERRRDRAPLAPALAEHD